MKKLILVLGIMFLSNFGRAGVGDWMASGGVGLTISPDAFLIMPQVEYKIRPRIWVGPMLQVGLASFTLFTVSGTARYEIGNHARFKPSFEGGFGLATASSAFDGSTGVLFQVGMGFDYVIDSRMSVGTMLRGNFAPPLKTFFLSWPIVVGRFLL